jgi:CBS domain-containing protein
VICPTCGHDNLEGLDSCENCQADLRTVDIPRATNEFEARMQAPLSSLRPRAPEMVAPDTSAGDAIARMRNAAVDCLLVGEGNDLGGIFTERDAVLKLAGRPLEGVRVADAMTADPVILRTDDTVAVAIHKMAVGGFRHIPVVDDQGTPRGIVAAVDLFHYVLALR